MKVLKLMGIFIMFTGLMYLFMWGSSYIYLILLNTIDSNIMISINIVLGILYWAGLFAFGLKLSLFNGFITILYLYFFTCSIMCLIFVFILYGIAGEEVGNLLTNFVNLFFLFHSVILGALLTKKWGNEALSWVKWKKKMI